MRAMQDVRLAESLDRKHKAFLSKNHQQLQTFADVPSCSGCASQDAFTAMLILIVPLRLNALRAGGFFAIVALVDAPSAVGLGRTRITPVKAIALRANARARVGELGVDSDPSKGS